MLSLISIAVVAATLGLLAFGWLRGWSMTLTLAVTFGVVYILGSATSIAVGVTIAGSPVLDELAWRPGYLSPGAWMHWPTSLTSMFLHANAAHLLANLLVFVLMGLGFEERVGRARFLAIFAASGLFGTVLQSVSTLGSMIPLVGASGAVFGIIGAYATLYPRDKVILFFILIWPNAPVYLAAIVYVGLELFALTTIGAAGPVARYAHIGGLVVGVLIGLAMLRRGVPEEGFTKRTYRIEAERAKPLVRTPEQEALYARLLENRDEPELAQAWLERLARLTPCPQCGEPLEAAKGALRSPCGYRLAVSAKRD